MTYLHSHACTTYPIVQLSQRAIEAQKKKKKKKKKNLDRVLTREDIQTEMRTKYEGEENTQTKTLTFTSAFTVRKRLLLLLKVQVVSESFSSSIRHLQPSILNACYTCQRIFSGTPSSIYSSLVIFPASPRTL